MDGHVGHAGPPLVRDVGRVLAVPEHGRHGHSDERQAHARAAQCRQQVSVQARLFSKLKSAEFALFHKFWPQGGHAYGRWVKAAHEFA